jgi:2-enoate reductase
VAVHLQTGVREILDDGVLVKDNNGAEYKLAADSVILSTGYKPAPLAEKGRKIHLVGDCSKVGNLRTVIWQAWDVAMKL